MSDNQNPLVGKTITAIHVAKDKGAIRFDVEGGEPIIARADGDCCSHSWVDALDMPSLVLGSPVTAVEDVDMPNLGNGKEQTHSKDYDGEVIAYYGCKITTLKGQCVIDYRNESNGYYGGNLSWPNDSYFYGGVHGQNISKEEWEQVAPTTTENA